MTELIFYDISSPLARSYAPNPSKSRFALSFKGVPFRTTWVDILDIAAVRQGLGCAAVRRFEDGSPFYTLPMLQDPASGRVVGDSFEIAAFLDESFPEAGAGRLFPPDSASTGLDYSSPHSGTSFLVPLSQVRGFQHEAYARFNAQVDATFTAHVALAAERMPFNPETAEAVGALFAKRARLASWDQVRVPREARGRMLAAFEADLASLAQLFAVNPAGPYLEGARATYADMIVGGWLNMLSVTLPEEEWSALKGWHGGAFGRLHDALQADYFECK